jgi:DNA repair exonuclease SbcCD nuclease subunit
MAFKTLRSDRELVIVHSSDLHIEHDYMGSPYDDDPAAGLSAVLSTAQRHGADVVLVAAALWQPWTSVLLTALGLAVTALLVVLLPGNHDPVVGGSVYFFPHWLIARIPHVIGVTHEERVLFADLDLEIWGRIAIMLT